jgi:hypothetical protein
MKKEVKNLRERRRMRRSPDTRWKTQTNIDVSLSERLLLLNIREVVNGKTARAGISFYVIRQDHGKGGTAIVPARPERRGPLS